VGDDRLTVPALIRRWSGSWPQKPFMVTDERVLTYGELDEATRGVAARLVGGGITKGCRIGLLMPNGADWAVVALGVSRAGAVLVPLSTLLRPPELEAQLRTAGVEHLIVVPRFRGRDYLADLVTISPRLVPRATPLFDEILPRLRSITVWAEAVPADDEGAAEVPPGLVEAVETSVRPADDLVIIFTSGSRGAPKGVIHTHGGALAATAAGLAVRCLGPDDRLYIPMPFFWVGGYGTGLLSVLACGATLISEAQSEPERTLRLLERTRVTLFRGWPDQAATLAAHPSFTDADLTSLRDGSLEAILPMSKRSVPGARAPLLGMTESFGPYCGARLDRDLPRGKEGSCGRPFAGVEVRVVDVETSEAVEAGATGEIQLRGPNLMRGICGRLRSEVFTLDGFYPTGDLGRLDEDGFLFLDGRRDDMFKVRGATVYPSEVEAVLNALPAVQRAFVVDVVDGGVVHVAAVVVPEDAGACTTGDLEREVRSRLSSFKIPTRWVIIEAGETPTTATGKIDKEGLRLLLTSQKPGPPTTSSSDRVGQSRL